LDIHIRILKDALSTASMAPVPVLPKLPERGQTILDFTGSSTVRIKPVKPSKPPKPTFKVPSRVYQQWMSGSLYENQLAQQFKTARLVHYDLDESDPEGYALYRFSYSQELKLAAIEWASNTYIKGKGDGDLDELISRYAAAKRLGITSTMLRNWTRNRDRIANQKRGSRQGRITTKGQEDKMEQALFKEFQQARRVGKAIRAPWFRRYTRAIYRQLYPRRVT
jgi:hypothetical protein